MEYPYSYNLSPDFDPVVFWKAVSILDRYYSLSDQKVLEDPFDGTLLKKYISSQGIVEVHCDWDIGAVFIDATIPLDDILCSIGGRRV